MAQLAVGDEFAGCRVEAVVGRGGMGVIYRGTDLKLERPVAIKLIAADRSGDESARRRFEREARLMAAIDHPNVIPVYAAGEQDGALYLVMRFVDGTDLQRRLREGPLEPREAARIIDQVARALDAAHARGLVHRDIKPANVLLAGEHVYLTDFGITRLVDDGNHTTETGDWVGTIDFMSPEHLRGEETDARSDVYSLGCVLYACLTGVPPFKRTTTAATIAGHLNDRPPAPSVTHPGTPRAFDQIIGRALAKSPAYRYASAGELGEAAVAAAEGRPTRWGARGGRRTNHGPSEAPTRLIGADEGPTRVAVREDLAARPVPGPGAAGAGAVGGADAGAGAVGGADAGADAGAVGGADAGADADAGAVGGADAGAEVTRRQPRDAVPTLRMSGAGGGPEASRTPVAGLAAALGVVVAAVVVILVLHKSQPEPVRPFSSAQVSSLVDRFAAAYGSRDGVALSGLLAPQVTRVDPTSLERGAAAVLGDYRRQFKTRPLPMSYRLSGLVISGGWVGRAAGTYTLRLAGGITVIGHVAFAVERIAGEPRIALIATQQDSSSGAPARSVQGTTTTPVPGPGASATTADTGVPDARVPTLTHGRASGRIKGRRAGRPVAEA